MTIVSQLPGSLATFPNLGDWISLVQPGVVAVLSGKVEIGQGIMTALAQMVADELDVDMVRVQMVTVITDRSPDEGYTAGSMSVERSGEALRQVCAEVRALVLAEAAAVLGVPVAALVVHDGTISSGIGGPSTTYWELAGRVALDRNATGIPGPKAAGDRHLIGSSVGRIDIAGKISGARSFVHDLTFPGMVHGRVVRPPSPGARLVLVAADADGSGLPKGTHIVRDGDFLGVLANTEYGAVQAAAVLRAAATWHEEPSLPPEDDVSTFLRGGRLVDLDVDVEDGDGDGAVNHGVTPLATLTATYSRPFIAHASIAPSCALARWTAIEGDAGPDAALSTDLARRLDVWSHSQGPFPLRNALAAVVGIPEEAVVVHHAEGAGCYGHNGADDVALDAALLARAVPGATVRVVWSREDELGWAPFGSAMVVDLEASLDDAGCVVSWSFDTWSNSHVTRPGYAGPTGLLATAHMAEGLERPDFVDRGGLSRNAPPSYHFPQRTVRAHCQLDMPLRTSSLRSLGAFANVFAIESFMDELALEAGLDPLEFRLRHLRDERGRAVLEAAARAAGWGDALEDSIGLGIGFARYKSVSGWCAVVAEVEAVHEVRVRKLTVAADVGMIVNPDGVRNQLEGGAIQATSWTLKEQVRFDDTRVTSTTWETYPILRFSEVPAVDVVLLDRPEEPPFGAGEMAQGPTAAAIGNGLFAAVGLRLRDLPLTADRVAQAAAIG